MQKDIIIAIGTNYLQSAHMQWACQRLMMLYDNIRFSRILWTADIKGNGQWYMNRLAIATTDEMAENVNQQLKAIERDSQRTKEHVTLDLDLMQHGSIRYHSNDWPRPYISQLISDITLKS